MSAKEERGGTEIMERAARETRCYTLTGTARELDEAEDILAELQHLGEANEPRLLLVALNGQQNGVTFRTLATWEEE